MSRKNDRRGYILSALLAAAVGGLLVARMSDALPRMASKMMRGMMENMRDQMGADCSPEEF